MKVRILGRAAQCVCDLGHCTLEYCRRNNWSEVLLTGPCKMENSLGTHYGPGFAASPPDPVNHPPHYKSGGMEAIDVIEAFAHNNYHRGNALKYLLRADYKGHTKQDLQKAVWYIQREIDRLP